MKRSRNGSSQLIALSLAEIRRLIARLTHRHPAPADHILHCSHWRRRRQHQAQVEAEGCEHSALRGVIAAAEAESERTCEFCGVPGRARARSDRLGD
jgi:hypothetical protein